MPLVFALIPKIRDRVANAAIAGAPGGSSFSRYKPELSLRPELPRLLFALSISVDPIYGIKISQWVALGAVILPGDSQLYHIKAHPGMRLVFVWMHIRGR